MVHMAGPYVSTWSLCPYGRTTPHLSGTFVAFPRAPVRKSLLDLRIRLTKKHGNGIPALEHVLKQLALATGTVHHTSRGAPLLLTPIVLSFSPCCLSGHKMRWHPLVATSSPEIEDAACISLYYFLGFANSWSIWQDLMFQLGVYVHMAGRLHISQAHSLPFHVPQCESHCLT